ncbi:unnamed protein product [Strongylus vulgaris]|uniref:Homeobox domain-containing protein n=1 Tax=Strongylus vulgaris TaxID=40348 RepID=A0A3P7IZW6_STRVU|nr:unnamed protein product [Strongylus vulgaris]
MTYPFGFFTSGILPYLPFYPYTPLPPKKASHFIKDILGVNDDTPKLDDFGRSVENAAPSENNNRPIKKKKARTTFSGRQIFELERHVYASGHRTNVCDKHSKEEKKRFTKKGSFKSAMQRFLKELVFQ